MILLSDENQVGTASIANLPSNNDILKALYTSNDKDPAPSTQVLKVNQLCAVTWKGQQQHYNWYLGYIKGIAPLITWKEAHMAPTSSGIILKLKIYRLPLANKF